MIESDYISLQAQSNLITVPVITKVFDSFKISDHNVSRCFMQQSLNRATVT